MSNYDRLMAVLTEYQAAKFSDEMSKQSPAMQQALNGAHNNNLGPSRLLKRSFPWVNDRDYWINLHQELELAEKEK